MKFYPTDKIRNIVFLGASHSGKTTLLDAALHRTGASGRKGSVDDGSSACDVEPDEIERRMTLSAKVVPIEWMDHKINFIDTPGYVDFSGERLCSLAAADAAVFVLDSEKGPPLQLKKYWGLCNERNLPRAILLNKCDKENVDVEGLKNRLADLLGGKMMLFHMLHGSGENFDGVIDIYDKKLFSENTGPEGEPVPEDIQTQLEKERESFIESAVETDDDLLEKYLETGEVDEAKLSPAIVAAVMRGELCPVFCCSARLERGIVPFLRDVIRFFPGPGQTGELRGIDSSGNAIEIPEGTNAFVFKMFSEPQMGELYLARVYSGKLSNGMDLMNYHSNTSERLGHIVLMRGKSRIETDAVDAGDIVAIPKLKNTRINDTLTTAKTFFRFKPIEFPEPVVSYAIRTESRKDQERLGNAMGKILAMDPTINIYFDPEFNQSIIKGLGEVHIDVTMKKLKNMYNVSAVLDQPLIHYRETIKGTGDARYRHKKQSGGAGQFAEVAIRIEPLARGEGFKFVNQIVGGVIPGQFIPSCEKGIVEAMKEGVLAGYPVIDVQAAVYDGKDHPVDSKDIAFQIAARTAFKQAMEQAKPVLLEPIMKVEVTVPEQYAGDVNGNLNSRRGQVQGMEPQGEFYVIRALVPQSELHGYSGDLRSMTHGEGMFALEFSHYEEVPSHLASKVTKRDRELEPVH